MRNLKKFVLAAVMVGVLGSASAVYAATAKSPAEILSGLTGKNSEQVQKERKSGKTYGVMAKEEGKLDQFKKEILEQKKAVLDEKVKAGKLTQEEADKIYNQIKTNQASCDGTGNKKTGKKSGMGFGKKDGTGNGHGMGKGSGTGNCNGGDCIAK